MKLRGGSVSWTASFNRHDSRSHISHIGLAETQKSHDGIDNQSGYAASKMGVTGLTNNAVVEYGQYDIQINAIAPGAIMTAMLERGLRRLAGDDWQSMADQFAENNPMRRVGAPEEAVPAFGRGWLCVRRCHSNRWRTIKQF